MCVINVSVFLCVCANVWVLSELCVFLSEWVCVSMCVCLCVSLSVSVSSLPGYGS